MFCMVMLRMSIGPINREEGLESTQEIRDQFGIQKAQNIAYAEIDIDGEEDELLAMSGRTSPAGTVPVPVNRRFQVFETPLGHDRSYDSEVKLLEEIAVRITPKSKGIIRLFSEIAPCPSCQDVMRQFESAYSGIQLIVSHG